MKSAFTSMLAASALLAFAPASQAADIYKLDPMHTTVNWSINHFGFSNPTGKFSMVDGTLALDTAKPENSTVRATISIANLSTGIPKLDEHLKSKAFFDIATFPTATFVSNKVDVTGKDTAKVTGSLTLHGITKPVTLDVKLNRSGINMMKKQTVGFSMTTVLKRSEFGITSYLPSEAMNPALADDVKIDIESEANLELPEAK
jgi:polyisoprenoid-binding protein YceI